MKQQYENAPRRKGAMRRADVPPDVLQALNEGREETVNHALRTIRKQQRASNKS